MIKNSFLAFFSIIICIAVLGSCQKETRSTATTQEEQPAAEKAQEPVNREEQLPAITEILTQSTLESSADEYNIAHLVDGTSKSWAEGEEGPGIGIGLDVRLEASAKIFVLYVKNGFGAQKWYSANNRVKEMSIENTDGRKVEFQLADDSEPQKITLQEPIEGARFIIRILSVYKGEKFDDTCLTEIAFKPIDLPNQQDKKEIEAPIELSDAGYNLTLLSGGELKGSGSGMANCEAPFVTGSWGRTSDGRIYVHYVAKQNMKCFDEDAKEPEWKPFDVTLIRRDFDELKLMNPKTQ
ncbi:MAG TPA: hypothetical protein VMX56_09855 [Anaerolineales bacterium]|nr:hypothetical protein [Anaerolineales bacterium]